MAKEKTLEYFHVTGVASTNGGASPIKFDKLILALNKEAAIKSIKQIFAIEDETGLKITKIGTDKAMKILGARQLLSLPEEKAA